MNALENAYRQTTFRVFSGEDQIDLRIGEVSQPMTDLLIAQKTFCAAIITAWNPESVVTDPESNERAQQKLRRALECYQTLEAVGFLDDWREDSILAFGLAETSACILAKEFGQNAFVFIGADGTPRLITSGSRRDHPCQPGDTLSVRE